MRIATILAVIALLMLPMASWADHHEEAKKEKPETEEEVAEESTDEEGEGEAEEEKEKEPFKPFDEVTEDTELLEGFFDIYHKDGKLLLVIKPDQFDQDFLMNYELSQGVGARGLNGGTMLNIFEADLMALERHGDKIYLVKRPHQFRARSKDEAWNNVMDISFGSSIMASADIETIRKDDEAVLIDATKWFVSGDLADIGTWVKFAVSDTPGQPGQANLDDSRSYLSSVKVFEENVSLRSKLTFNIGKPSEIRLADWRSMPLEIHTTIAALPEKPMEPREADDRMGYFLTVHKDFTHKEDSFFTRYVNRWRLERGKKRGNLYEPKKPIVYHVDHTIPEEYRDAVKQGIEAWQKSFEAAGWKNAIIAKDLPKDADAEDIRYATIRWVATDSPGYLAIGPSVVDPRTGEILDADILFDATFALRVSRDWENLVEPSTALEALFADPVSIPGVDCNRAELASFATQLSLEASMVRSSLLARGEIKAGDPVPKEYVKQFLLWVTMHEVGHSLGLRHNFRSSTDTPVANLHDATWTEAHGLVSSVMDYAAANVAPKGQKNGQYFSTTVGTSDDWVISYGYHHDADKAAEIARQGAKAGHAYGSDMERSGVVTNDPSVNAWDLSDDPLNWSKERTTIVADLWSDVADRVLVDNAPRSDLTAVMQNLLGSYATSMGPALKYVGGQYTYRDHAGDPNARDPFVPVAKAEQEEALDHIVDRLLREGAMELPQDVLTQMAPNRFAHWGSNMTFNGRIDYPYHEQVLNIQQAYLSQLTHPYRLARMCDSELKFGADRVLTMPELFGRITTACWSELNGAGNISSTRRNLQRAYVDRMTTLLTDPPSRMPADVRSVTRWELSRLNEKIAQRIDGGAGDTYTLAHLTEIHARVTDALEAGLEVELLGN